MRKIQYLIIIIVHYLVLIALIGCDKDQNTENREQKQKYKNQDKLHLSPIIDWGSVDQIVIDAEKPPGSIYYLLKGSVVNDFRVMIEEVTITSAESKGACGALQTVGADINVYLLDKEGKLIHRFPIQLQSVEGMRGDKKHRDEKDEIILESQFKNRDKFLGMVETKGQQLSKEQADQYIEQSKELSIGYEKWRCWKK